MFMFIVSPKNTENTNISEVNNSDEEVRKLYRRTSIYIRSLYSVLRLLPTYSIVQKNFQLSLEVFFNSKDQEDNDKRLRESLMSLSFLSLHEENQEEKDGSSTKSFESVNQTDLSLLQTNHGNLEISVAFRKTLSNSNFNLYKITKSPAIRVPQQKRMIKARDILIKSGSSPGSGDWIDMAQHLPALVMNSNKRTPNQHPTGQIKILAAHKPSPSSLSSRKPQGKIMQLTEFIKIFEKPEAMIHDITDDTSNIHNTNNTNNANNTNIIYNTYNTSSTNTPSLQQLIQVLEEERSKKILFDRWLEEMEIIHENILMNGGEGFDLINNME